MSAYNATVRARVQQDIKTEAEIALNAIGLDMSDAIRLFINQVAIRKEFPLELRIPNATTLAAMNAGADSEAFDNADDLFDSILNEESLEVLG